MSHRKFEKPRSGNLGFLPRKRCRRGRGKIKSFPKEKVSDKPHLTAFLGYKVGCSHIVRDLDRQGSKLHQKEISEQVTYVETPPMVVFGITGYKITVTGLTTATSVFAQKLDDGFRRKLHKRWHTGTRKSYTKYAANPDFDKVREERLKVMEEQCTVIRVLAHTQPTLLPQLNRRKAHVVEIQINGGSCW